MLATIIHTSGSTPSVALSKMLVTDTGMRLFGTIGGGCVEGDVLHAAMELSGSGCARIMRFHLDEDHPENDMLCGGTLDVLIEPLGADCAELVSTVQVLRDKGKDCVIATVVRDDGRVTGKFVVQLDDDAAETLLRNVRELVPGVSADVIEKAHLRREVVRFPFSGGELILEPIGAAPQLLIFGGGHISKYLSSVASTAGFHVTVIDDRREFAGSERFPEASKTLTVEFADAFQHVKVTPLTCIVIVTRGHRSDEDVLRNAINTPAKYIGMIGSKRKVLATYEHLIDDGVSVEDLQRVHAPIGLDIGAVTAEEIAVSIVAELIYVWRGERKPLSLKSDGMKSVIVRRQQIPHK